MFYSNKEKDNFAKHSQSPEYIEAPTNARAKSMRESLAEIYLNCNTLNLLLLYH